MMNPWISIWTKPRQTIRQIVETNPTRGVLPLALAAGISTALMQAMDSLIRAGLGPPVALSIAVAVGAVMGVVWLYLFGWLYRWVGGWFGGQAKNAEVRAAIAWVEVPTFAIVLCWALLVLPSFLAGRSAAGEAHPLAAVGVVAFALAAFAIGIWKLVLACHTVGEVHRFSAWKGLGTMLIPNLIIMVPIVVVALFAAIAIPNALRARSAANEAAAIGNLQALVSSVESYRLAKQAYPTSAQWSQLYPAAGEAAHGPPAFKDAGALVSYPLLGYLYTYHSDGVAFSLTASPQEWPATGSRSFYADQTGVVRHCAGTAQAQAADADDKPVEAEPLPC